MIVETYPVLVAWALLAAGPAPSERPIGAELLGQTTVSEFPDGTTVRMNYHEDGSFTGRLGAQTWSGTYWFTKGKLCLRTSTELECWPYAARMVPGRVYDVTAPDGTKVRVRLLR